MTRRRFRSTILDAYLLQTFRRVVLAELEKDNNRRRFEVEASIETEWHAQASNVERRILIAEIVNLMDEWARSILEWLTLDYSFDEIAPPRPEPKGFAQQV